MLGVSQSRGLKLFGCEIIFEEFQPMCSRYLIVTDGQTDGRLTVASPHSALASRGKNASQSLTQLGTLKAFGKSYFTAILLQAQKYRHAVTRLCLHYI